MIPFKKAVPKKFSLDYTKMVKTSIFPGDCHLPLIVEPVSDSIDPIAWASNQQPFVAEKLQQHGALLFRGFDIKHQRAFEAFASANCPELFGGYGDLPHAGGNIYDVTPYPHEGTIYFHNESSHLSLFPLRQFFYCDLPAHSGGETPVVDCRKLSTTLPEEMIDAFRTKGLCYIRNFIEGLDVDWRDFFKTNDPREVESQCDAEGIDCRWKGKDLFTRQWAPAIARHPDTNEEVFFNQIQLHHSSCLDKNIRAAMDGLFHQDDFPRNVTFGDGTPIPDDWVDLIRSTSWSLSTGFSWQKGDVLLVDNMLVAHARNPYEPPRKMYVAMGQMTRLNHSQPIGAFS